MAQTRIMVEQAVDSAVWKACGSRKASDEGASNMNTGPRDDSWGSSVLGAVSVSNESCPK